MIKYSEIDLEKLSVHDKIRLLNYIEIEYGYGGQYEINNKEGIDEIIYEFDLDYENIISMMFNLDDYSNNDLIVYYNRSDKCLESINESDLNLDLISNKLDGELKMMLSEMIGEDILWGE